MLQQVRRMTHRLSSLFPDIGVFIHIMTFVLSLFLKDYEAGLGESDAAADGRNVHVLI